MLLSRALDRYTHVLHKQHNNVFAANGAAAVLFQTGRVREAKQMFSQIREAAPDVADVWVNLAHAYLVQGEYVGAIKLYEATLHKFFKGTDVELLRCMAHAEFVHASAISKDKKNVRDPMSIIRKQRDMLQRSRRMLQKAMHLNPLDYSLQFNMAVVLKKHAEIIIEGVRDSHNRYMEAHKDQKAFVPEIQIDDLEQVKNDLVVMRRIAGRLAKIDNEKEFPVRDKEIAETEYEAYGNEMAKILPKYFEAVDDHHREFHRHKNQILEEEKDAERRKEEERRQKMEEDLEIRRAREEKAAELERLKEELTVGASFRIPHSAYYSHATLL
jgi:tetratricopeptide (TPR) repeat protein